MNSILFIYISSFETLVVLCCNCLLEISESQELTKLLGERQEVGRKGMKTIGQRTFIDIKYTIYKERKQNNNNNKKRKEKKFCPQFSLKVHLSHYLL